MSERITSAAEAHDFAVRFLKTHKEALHGPVTGDPVNPRFPSHIIGNEALAALSAQGFPVENFRKLYKGRLEIEQLVRQLSFQAGREQHNIERDKENKQ